MNSFWLWNSFRMSFWIVPPRVSHETPRCSAIARYIAQMTAAGPLIVCETVTLSIGMSAYRRCMSSIVEIATPHLPTSPTHSGSSLSRPISVGRSNAVESPVFAAVEDFACASRYLNRLFVSSALPNPANCRIVHSRERYPWGKRPRVYGNSPGRGSSLSSFFRDAGSVYPCFSGPYEGSKTSPEIVTACGSTCGSEGFAAGLCGAVVMPPLYETAAPWRHTFCPAARHGPRPKRKQARIGRACEQGVVLELSLRCRSECSSVR